MPSEPWLVGPPVPILTDQQGRVPVGTAFQCLLLEWVGAGTLGARGRDQNGRLETCRRIEVLWAVMETSCYKSGHSGI